MKKNRILIIDHSDSARTLLFKKLRAEIEDVEIIACSNAKEAMTACNRYEFHIITTSIDLPDTNGYQLIDQIRDSNKNSDTAIFVVSSNNENQMIEEFDIDETKAVTAYFDKSDGHKSLVTFISDFLQKSDVSTARLIYVDNSSTSSAIICSILETNGFHFQHFKSSQQGLDFIRNDINENDQCTYDILITDILLSGTIIGYDLVKTIRQELKLDYLSLPILLLTQEPDEDEKTDFTGIFGAGTNDFLAKPVSENDLLERLQILLNIKRQNEALHQ